MQNTVHTIKLQDGTLFNFKRRFKKHHQTLLSSFEAVNDGRDEQGLRHDLAMILVVVFWGILCGQTTLKDCWLSALHNLKFLSGYIDFPHGLPHPTTLSRTLQVCDVESLVKTVHHWQQVLFGTRLNQSASFDGKTMNGVHGQDAVRHILSLFCHTSHQTLSQVGVNDKENEIPAAKRLFQTTDITGLTLVADALHAQKDTAKTIIDGLANYLLFVKGNQEILQEIIAATFADPLTKTESASYCEHTRGRHLTTTVTISNHFDIDDLKKDWAGVSFVGMVEKTGTRTEKETTSFVDERYHFIASNLYLTAKQAARLVRDHWRIENNLHWQKDFTFHEDQQTLRMGAAPQVMTFLRSLCIGLFKGLKLASVTNTVKNLQMNPALHQRFAIAVNIV